MGNEMKTLGVGASFSVTYYTQRLAGLLIVRFIVQQVNGGMNMEGGAVFAS